MAKFKDSAGREWVIALNVGVIGQLKRDAHFDLGKAAEAGERFGDLLFADPSTLADMLWCLLQGQHPGWAPNSESFAFLLDPETLDAACDALFEAVVDFFHRRRAGAMKARLPKLLAKMDAEITAAMGNAADVILNAPAGSSPASSESIPAR